MKNRNRVVLPLAGGLGNQLFQYAHAFSRKLNSQIVIEPGIFQPRKNSFGEPELLDLQLPGEIFTSKNSGRVANVLSRVCSLLLRIGSGDLSSTQKGVFIVLIRPIVRLLFRISRGEWVTVKVAKDVGYSKISAPKNPTLYIGYFQSYKWLQENQDSLSAFKSLRPRTISAETFALTLESKSKNILGIHIRLGDYLQEERIGLLPKEYYARALRYLEIREYNEIWIFTNDVKGAIDVLPTLPKVRQVWIPAGLSSAETLHLMTFCNDFIISNSTFSWWGAYLNRKCDGIIICPEVWFEKSLDPADICPPDWVRVKSFESTDDQEL